MRILLVEDDHDTADTIKDELSKSYVVEVSSNGEDGELKAQVNEYDLIILDSILPGISGVDVCRKLRQSHINTPILMLTGKSEIAEKVAALDSGADDYLTKPFSFDELFARIRALIRRPDTNQIPNVISVDDLRIDLTTKQVVRGEKAIHLRRKELYLLEYLARNVGRVMTRDMILNHVWDSVDEPETNIVDVHVKYLRDAIDKDFDKKLIKTVHGLGYKLEA